MYHAKKEKDYLCFVMHENVKGREEGYIVFECEIKLTGASAIKYGTSRLLDSMAAFPFCGVKK